MYKPSSNKRTNSREFAYMCLEEVSKRDAYFSEVFSSLLRNVDISPSDKAYAQVLGIGVINTLGTLDLVINRSLNSPKDINDNVRNALRIATFEKIFLKKEDYFVVNEGVNLVSRFIPRAKNLANAVLRKICKDAQFFPYGNVESDLEACANFFGFPYWMAHLLQDTLGCDSASEFMAESNNRAPLFMLINKLHPEFSEIVKLVERYSDKFSRVILFAGSKQIIYKIVDEKFLTDGRLVKYLNDGAALISDYSAILISTFSVNNLVGKDFLEIGSGRGTKTIVIQNAAYDAFGTQLNLSCVDLHRFKNELLQKRTSQANVKVDACYTGDARTLDSVLPPQTSYDGILIDAPCSGLGTLRRHPEIRWRLKPESVPQLAQTGLQILQSAAAFLNIKGILTYSTCTVTSQENELVIKAFLNSKEGANFRLLPFLGNSSYAPGLVAGGCDAHFAVRLQRIG